ncbi:MAG TPA: HAMP domain-containing sensor histidine kinase [Gemmatimonadaceae bacterium]|nr:HAMP domain-containing sensor histidine kinase [Gemmatimonadaceae bacterium]
MAGASGGVQPGGVFEGEADSGHGGEAAARRGEARPVPAAVWRALTAAAAEVAVSWIEDSAQAATASDVRLAVSAVADAIRRAAGGGSAAVGPLPPLVPARSVLERLRRSFLDQLQALDALEHAADALQVLRAFEAVQEELDRDAAHRFAARLTGPQAQQLVVEMAHDMRSPLGSILILAERLRAGAGGELSPVQRRQLGLIYSAAFGLSSLAGDVIELARGGTTLLEQRPIAFSVSDVLQSVLDILRPMAEEKRIAMRAQGPAVDVRVGHPLALNRVLLNLATNALKFTNSGSVEMTCKELDRTKIEFSVKDTGRGIPAHVLQNLFETFRQRHSAGDYAFSSAGLGLSICQKLVRAMGGELGVETELEKGTRFFFTLELPPAQRV